MRMFYKSSKLKQKLAKAIQREKLACETLAKKHVGGEWQEYKEASEGGTSIGAGISSGK
jgi:hypothetical protein